MLPFTCYRLHETLGGQVPADLDEYIDVDDQMPTIHGPVERHDFIAKLYIAVGQPHPPLWAGFVRSGFGGTTEREVADAKAYEVDPLGLPLSASVGAAIVLKLVPEGNVFAFTFGTTGRFLLKHESWQRGYGLQTALNLIYPRVNATGRSGKLVAVDAKRRGGEIIRSRQQASRATTFEAFDVDKIRDLVGGATGEPNDHKWGRRITGTDQLAFAAASDFDGLGTLCRELDEAHDRDDYKDRFAWLDSIRPIHDPDRLSEIEEYLVGELLTGDVSHLNLSPPEVVDWTRVVGFRYHYDGRRASFMRSGIQLEVYLKGLRYYEGDPDSVDVDYFRRKNIRALDEDGQTVHRWAVWRCISGEFQFKDATFTIDEGEIFEVSSDFLGELDENISGLGLREDLPWPVARSNTLEDAFNGAAMESLSPALLMDKRLVKSRMQTTPVEVCDVLTADRRLVHAKLKLGSRDLSHLFSQGYVSAELLRSDPVFREAVHKKIKELGGDDRFDFFNVANLQPSDFEIVYAIVAPWGGRSPAAGLPFFSKINLMRTAENLTSRGFKVALARIDTR